MSKRKQDAAAGVPPKAKAAKKPIARYETTRIANFRAIFELLKDFQPNVNLHFISPDDRDARLKNLPPGIVINAMERSSTALVNVTLGIEEINGPNDTLAIDQTCTSGVPVAQLYNAILKRVKAENRVVFELFRGGDTLHISVEGSDGATIDYQLWQLDIDEECISIPEQAMEHMISLNAWAFDEALATIASTGCDGVTIECVGDSLQLSSAGRGVSVMYNLPLRQGEGGGDGGAATAFGRNTYSIRFVTMFARLHRVAGETPMIMYFGSVEDRNAPQPLIVEYSIPNFGSIKCCLTPKCVDDEAPAPGSGGAAEDLLDDD